MFLVFSHRRRRHVVSLTDLHEAATIILPTVGYTSHIFELLTVGTFFQRLHAGLSRMAAGDAASIAYSCTG